MTAALVGVPRAGGVALALDNTDLIGAVDDITAVAVGSYDTCILYCGGTSSSAELKSRECGGQR